MSKDDIEELLSDIPAVSEFQAEGTPRRESRWGEVHTGFYYTGELPFRPESLRIDLSALAGAVLRSIVMQDPQTQILAGEIGAIRTELAELRELIAERPTIRPTLLTSLGSTGMQLLAPIAIVIEEYEDECLARWPEAQATGRGINESTAIDSLRNDIAFLYRDLMDTDESAMVPDLVAVRDLLHRIIKA